MAGSIAAVKLPIASGVSRAGSIVMKTWPTSMPRSARASAASALRERSVGQMSGQKP